METKKTKIVSKGCGMEERIIQAALHIIQQYGFRKFTMDDVSETLRISKKTLYKYFPSKQKLVSDALDYFIKKNREETLKVIEDETTWLDKLNAIVGSSYAIPTWLFTELSRFYPDEWRKVEALHKFKIEQFHMLLREGAQKGELNPAINLEIIAPMIEEILNRLLQMEFLAKHDLTVRQLLKQLSEVLFNGILKTPKS